GGGGGGAGGGGGGRGGGGGGGGGGAAGAGEILLWVREVGRAGKAGRRPAPPPRADSSFSPHAAPPVLADSRIPRDPPGAPGRGVAHRVEAKPSGPRYG